MLLLYVVREIFALEDAVSFNFAFGAPHVKRRVKSRRPASAAPTYISGLTQDYSNSTANALELLQSCTKPSICMGWFSIWTTIY